MRLLATLLALLVAACGNDSMTRTFSLSRDASPQTMASAQLPLSAPPSLGVRPTRPVIVPSGRGGSQGSDQAPVSPGQSALLDASGPAAEPDIRVLVNENSGLVYPDRSFVDQLLTWAPPPGYTPIITDRPRSSWLGRLF